MERWLRALCVALAVGCVLAGAAEARGVKSEAVEVAQVRHAIAWQKGRTWHWEDAARVRRSPAIRGVGRYHSTGYLHWIERRWNRRRLAAYKLAHRPRPTYRTLASSGGIAHEALWLCIHSGYLNGRRVSTGEGAWPANTGNGYLGGLQMTPGWGGVARPDLLSPAAQMQLAERGYAAAHYSTVWLVHQWPNTAPPCLSLA